MYIKTMKISIVGVIINSIMLIIIVILIIIGLKFNNELNVCETKQSTFCYTIRCPCDLQSEPPCFGFAKMPAETPGYWYCSNAPLTRVDSNGNIA